MAHGTNTPRQSLLAALQKGTTKSLPASQRAALSKAAAFSLIAADTGPIAANLLLRYLAVATCSKASTPDELRKAVGAFKVAAAADAVRRDVSTRRREVARLRKLADTVAERNLAAEYRTQAEQLAATLPETVDELRVLLVKYQEQAAVAATPELADGWRTAAAKVLQRIEELAGNEPTPAVGKASGLAPLYSLADHLETTVAAMHRRIDSLLAHEGYPTPPRVPINKSAGVGERFVSIRSNYLAAEQRLDALNDLPLRSGPTRMRKTVDAATAAAADKAAALALHYEQIANTVNDRDLADSYRTLAKNARTEAAK